MRRQSILTILLTIAAGFGAACNSDHNAPNREQPNMNNRAANSATPASPSPANDAKNPDSAFLTEAAQGGMAEVMLGRLAASKAQNPDVKKFGQRMVDDHTKANNELKELAVKKNFTLPTDVNAKQKSLMDKLEGLSGADFDKAYVDAMVDDHEEDVDDFKDEAENGKDADVKAWAAKTVPTLQSHLDMIKGIQSKIK